jgi:ribosomal protein L30/L7E
MNAQLAVTKGELKEFYRFPHLLYKGNNAHRATEESLVRLIVSGPTEFHAHARVFPYNLLHRKSVVGRFALIHDTNLEDYIQVAFFEADSGLHDILQIVRDTARERFPSVNKIIIGLNGHLNYGAGILLNRFDEPPVFGLPYSPSWYGKYFSKLYCRTTVSFRFPTKAFFDWNPGRFRNLDMHGITFRFMNMKNLRREVELYTYIDNTSFTNTRYWYWSNRKPIENYELIHPFRFLLREENLVFAEKNGEPVGFLLWYPDFNELVHSSRPITIVDVIRHRCTKAVRTMRLTEVALLPKYRQSPAVIGMLLKIIPYIRKRGLSTCEGGFIFEENRNSMVMTSRLLERAFGIRGMEPYRRYGIFEGEL